MHERTAGNRRHKRRHTAMIACRMPVELVDQMRSVTSDGNRSRYIIESVSQRLRAEQPPLVAEHET